eukprot:Protomagalhaensia_wolfi_Nauph_80__2317@NODE_2517_length_1070_cov_14_120272_g1973_i0_p1_GENE_NODE_2517_length_1070_cov_14_120272_g1973_i0NODE_2517_length_1070_cov_14_120272_g1973_i0_p1_ORF_typecomplete_len196_score15_63_NODE_2517_length_1070_cov_14_120272_g1973_i0230817
MKLITFQTWTISFCAARNAFKYSFEHQNACSQQIEGVNSANCRSIESSPSLKRQCGQSRFLRIGSDVVVPIQDCSRPYSVANQITPFETTLQLPYEDRVYVPNNLDFSPRIERRGVQGTDGSTSLADNECEACSGKNRRLNKTDETRVKGVLPDSCEANWGDAVPSQEGVVSEASCGSRALSRRKRSSRNLGAVS